VRGDVRCEMWYEARGDSAQAEGGGWVSSGPGTAAWLCAVRKLGLLGLGWRLASGGGGDG
jgi:hypothetical protein